MEQGQSDSWHVIKARAEFAAQATTALPTAEVYVPVSLTKKYNRRVRKWNWVYETMWPGYAFMRGEWDETVLRSCSMFFGFVRMDDTRVVIPNGDLIKAVKLGEKARKVAPFNEGDVVRFGQVGPLFGKEGTVQKIRDVGFQWQVAVEVDENGRTHKVQVGAELIHLL